MASIASWIYDKPLRGNYTFTHDEVAQAFPGMSAGSIARALTREVSKGRIMSPLRGFYVIVPDEYVLRGAVPQSFYLDEPPAMRDKKGEKYLTHYFCKSHIPEAYVERRQTRTGYINVSCPELTAVDLLTYQAKTGSVSRAATVLAELAEKLDFGRLAADFVKEVPVTSLQRLGYILDEVLEEGEAAESVYSLLKCSGFVLQYAPLKAGKSSEGCERNAKWRIIVNETIEIDEL